MELAQGCAVSAASVAAIADVWSRRIPNWVTFGTLALGLLLNTYLRGEEGAALALVGALLGIGLLLPFYAVGGVKAGDVKLLGAVGAVLGPQALVSVALYGALAGGLRSAVILLRRGYLRLAFGDVVEQHRLPRSSGATGAFGVVIAAGVILSVFLPSVVG
jgi:prepilin peptidase CpaA